jgi:hypothetical protein
VLGDSFSCVVVPELSEQAIDRRLPQEPLNSCKTPSKLPEGVKMRESPAVAAVNLNQTSCAEVDVNPPQSDGA